MTDTFKDAFFAEFRAKMTAAFDSSDTERAHADADDLLRQLVDKLLTWDGQSLTAEHRSAIRHGLALYDAMAKWYA